MTPLARASRRASQAWPRSHARVVLAPRIMRGALLGRALLQPAGARRTRPVIPRPLTLALRIQVTGPAWTPGRAPAGIKHQLAPTAPSRSAAGPPTIASRLVARSSRLESVTTSARRPAFSPLGVAATPRAPLPAAAPPVPRVLRRGATALPAITPAERPAPQRESRQPFTLAQVPPHEVERLAERVMDTLDRRVMALRERRGRS